jgi:hypothetical protein
MEAETHSPDQDPAAQSPEESYIDLLEPSEVADEMYNADKKHLY